MTPHDFSLIDFLAQHFNHKNNFSLIGEVVFILLCTLLISYLITIALSRLQKSFRKTVTSKANALVGAMRKPIQLIIWTIGISTCLDVANIALHIENYTFTTALRAIIIIMAITWFAMGVISELEKFWSKNANKDTSKIDRTTADALVKILRISTIIIALLTIAESLGFSVAGIIAFAGGSSLVIGFASKDLLANFFGALMIYLDTPFKVGEWIRVPEKNIEGHVAKVGLRCTIINTLEKRPLYVPNSVFTSASIENASRMTHRKIYETIGLRHEDIHLLASITDEIHTYLKSNKDVDTRLPLVVNINSFSSSSVDILLCVYTKSTDMEAFHRIKHRIMLKVAEVIEKHEAKLAHSSSTINFSERYLDDDIPKAKSRKAAKT